MEVITRKYKFRGGVLYVLLSEVPFLLNRKAIACHEVRHKLMHFTTSEVQFLQVWSVELHLEQILYSGGLLHLLAMWMFIA